MSQTTSISILIATLRRNGAKFLPLFLFLPGCFSSTAETKGKFPPRCQSTATEPDYYLVSSVTTEPEKVLASQVTSALARSYSRKTTIDQLNGDQLYTLFSSEHNQRAIQSIANQWIIAPILDSGIATAIQRIQTFGNSDTKIALQVYIVGSGTSDPAALSKIRTAANNIKSFHCLQVNFIGVAPAHRLKMAEALSPLRDRLRFSGSNYQEYQTLID
jgi:hypothetical protein